MYSGLTIYLFLTWSNMIVLWVEFIMNPGMICASFASSSNAIINLFPFAGFGVCLSFLVHTSKSLPKGA